MEAQNAGIAAHIDPKYAEKLVSAMEKGVEVIAWRVFITPEEIVLDTELPFVV